MVLHTQVGAVAEQHRLSWKSIKYCMPIVSLSRNTCFGASFGLVTHAAMCVAICTKVWCDALCICGHFPHNFCNVVIVVVVVVANVISIMMLIS